MQWDNCDVTTISEVSCTIYDPKNGNIVSVTTLGAFGDPALASSALTNHAITELKTLNAPPKAPTAEVKVEVKVTEKTEEATEETLKTEEVKVKVVETAETTEEPEIFTFNYDLSEFRKPQNKVGKRYVARFANKECTQIQILEFSTVNNGFVRNVFATRPEVLVKLFKLSNVTLVLPPPSEASDVDATD